MRTTLAEAKSIAVVIDTLVLSDIEGKDAGFNVEKNATQLEEASAAVREGLEEKNIPFSMLRAGTGMGFQPVLDVYYFCSEKFKSTGDVFRGVDFPSKLGRSLEVREFLNSAVLRGGRKGPDPISPSMHVPDLLRGSDADVLIFVRTLSGAVSAWKTFGSLVLTSTTSLAASGGTMAFYSASINDLHLDVSYIEMKSGRILWHKSMPLQNADSALMKQRILSTLRRVPVSITS